MKLVKVLQLSLRQLHAAECSWTVDMDGELLRGARKLEKLGLVRFVPCYTGQRAKGHCRGRLNGYNVMLTPLGKAQS
jgi:hypothetical protein